VPHKTPDTKKVKDFRTAAKFIEEVVNGMIERDVADPMSIRLLTSLEIRLIVLATKTLSRKKR